MGASLLERSKYLASPMKHSIRSKSADPIKASLYLSGDASILKSAVPTHKALQL